MSQSRWASTSATWVDQKIPKRKWKHFVQMRKVLTLLLCNYLDVDLWSWPWYHTGKDHGQRSRSLHSKIFKTFLVCTKFFHLLLIFPIHWESVFFSLDPENFNCCLLIHWANSSKCLGSGLLINKGLWILTLSHPQQTWQLCQVVDYWLLFRKLILINNKWANIYRNSTS